MDQIINVVENLDKKNRAVCIELLEMTKGSKNVFLLTNETKYDILSVIILVFRLIMYLHRHGGDKSNEFLSMKQPVLHVKILKRSGAALATSYVFLKCNVLAVLF